jgi:hypothetical protein
MKTYGRSGDTAPPFSTSALDQALETIIYKGKKSKAIPVTGRGGLYG